MTDKTEELMRAVIANEVERQLASQEEELIKGICQGLEETDSLEKSCAKMVRNGIIISINIAADIAIGFLIESGLCEPKSDDKLRRNLFSVVGQGNGETDG